MVSRLPLRHDRTSASSPPPICCGRLCVDRRRHGSRQAQLSAEGDGVVRDYMATVTVDSDGSLEVSEELAYADSGSSDGTRDVERSIVTREHYDAEDDRVYDVSDVQAEVDDAGVDAEIDSIDGGERWTLTIPNSATTVQWTYTVEGAVAQTADGLEVRWPVVQGFDREIDGVRVDWNAPDVLWLSCLTGSLGSARPCTTSQLAEGPAPTMTPARGSQRAIRWSASSGLGATAGRRPHRQPRDALESVSRIHLVRYRACCRACPVGLWPPGERLVVVDDEVATPRRRLLTSRARYAAPETARGCSRRRVRSGRDRWAPSWTSAPMSSMSPRPSSISRPGTTCSSRRSSAARSAGWIGCCAAVTPPVRSCSATSATIFEAIFAESDQVLVSALAGALRNTLGSVQASMYADMVDQGWFAERPDAVRGRWTTAGWVLIACGVVLSVVLALVSTSGWPDWPLSSAAPRSLRQVRWRRRVLPRGVSC